MFKIKFNEMAVTSIYSILNFINKHKLSTVSVCAAGYNTLADGSCSQLKISGTFDLEERNMGIISEELILLHVWYEYNQYIDKGTNNQLILNLQFMRFIIMI